ncbi:hypothetical protein [Microcoleus sp. Aus8_D4]|uniref:hypothetical protein n=1 Tax=Microcoleus sp. Aus8_D4 TaxID=2818634 RepID=UPI002FD74A66
MQDLTTKTLKELKAMAELSLEIAYKNGIYYQGDRRQRQSWVSFLERCWEAGIVLAFLPKTEPAFEVNVEEPDENIPGVETQAPALPENSDTLAASPGIEIEATEPIANTDYLNCPRCGTVGGLYAVCPGRETIWETHCTHCEYAEPSIRHPFEDVRPFEVDRAQKPPIESKFGRIVYPQPAVKPIVPAAESEAEASPMANSQAASNPPGVEVESTACDRFVYVGSRRFLAIEAVMEEAVDKKTFGEPVYPEWPESWLPAVENSLNVDREFHRPWTDTDRWNPADFGEVLHAVEPGGQLNLLEWDTNEPPDPDDYPLMTDFHDAYDRWLLEDQIKEVFEKSDENNDAVAGTCAEPAGADEIAIAAGLPSGCDNSAELHGTGGDNQNEGLGSKKGDRLLEESRPDSGGAGGVLSHQPPELVSDAIVEYLQAIGHKIAPNIAPPAPNITATFNDEQPPNRGDGRHPKLAIGMQVGHRSDLRPLGTIADIYTSKKGKLRAKIERPKIGGFVYFDCDLLVEEKFHYWDYPAPVGSWKKTRFTTWVKGSGCDVWVRKQPAPARTNWTQDQLRSFSPFKLKKIARDMGIFSIPGSSCKRSLMRAILAEQELRNLAIEKEFRAPLPQATKLGSEPAKKQAGKRAKTAQTPEPLGQQLSLNLFPAAS